MSGPFGAVKEQSSGFYAQALTVRGFIIDSETTERMVVYQALYGEGKFWVRPEKMFFENVERDGRRFPRFTEIDSRQK